MKKQELIEAIANTLHIQARNKGYVCAGIGEAGYRKMARMAKAQLQQELDRLQGKIELKDLPKNHICFIV